MDLPMKQCSGKPLYRNPYGKKKPPSLNRDVGLCYFILIYEMASAGHCEEVSDEAILLLCHIARLLRYARNDDYYAFIIQGYFK